MKLNTTQEEVKFKPVTLSITFESEEELRVFHEMSYSDYSIPDLLHKKERLTREESKILSEMLTNINDKLDRLKE